MICVRHRLDESLVRIDNLLIIGLSRLSHHIRESVSDPDKREQWPQRDNIQIASRNYRSAGAQARKVDCYRMGTKAQEGAKRIKKWRRTR